MGRPTSFGRRSGSRHAPLESKTFAIDRTSLCSVRANRRRAGRHPLDCAIFRLRLVSWTCVLLRTVLAPPRGCGHFGQVLDGWRRHLLAAALSDVMDGAFSGRHPFRQYIETHVRQRSEDPIKQRVTSITVFSSCSVIVKISRNTNNEQTTPSTSWSRFR